MQANARAAGLKHREGDTHHLRLELEDHVIRVSSARCVQVVCAEVLKDRLHSMRANRKGLRGSPCRTPAHLSAHKSINHIKLHHEWLKRLLRLDILVPLLSKLAEGLALNAVLSLAGALAPHAHSNQHPLHLLQPRPTHPSVHLRPRYH